MSRDNGFLWYTHSTYITEIKEYDIRAHVYSMVALWWMSNRTLGQVDIVVAQTMLYLYK